MNDADILKVIMDSTRSITNLNNIIINLHKSIDSLVNSLHETNTNSTITNHKVDELKELIKITQSSVEEIKKKLEMLVIQSDFKEMLTVKSKKLSDKLDKELEEHKWNWTDFWDTMGKFWDNAKWVVLALVIVIILYLIGTKVINWNDVWNFIKGLVPKVITS
jgi:hypothetical protein